MTIHDIMAWAMACAMAVPACIYLAHRISPSYIPSRRFKDIQGELEHQYSLAGMVVNVGHPRAFMGIYDSDRFYPAGVIILSEGRLYFSIMQEGVKGIKPNPTLFCDDYWMMIGAPLIAREKMQ